MKKLLNYIYKRLGVELEELTSEQASYIGVEQKGPYKPDYYRY